MTSNNDLVTDGDTRRDLVSRGLQHSEAVLLGQQDVVSYHYVSERSVVGNVSQE